MAQSKRMEQALIVFFAIAIVVVVIAVIVIFIVPFIRDRQPLDVPADEPQEEIIAQYNLSGTVQRVDGPVIQFRTPEGRDIHARVTERTTINAETSQKGVAALSAVSAGDEVTIEFMTHVRVRGETEASYVTVSSRDGELVRKESRLPAIISSVSGTVNTVQAGGFTLNSLGNNFGDPAASPAVITITVGSSTQLVIGSERLRGADEVLSRLEPNMNVLIQSGDNIRDASVVEASIIRTF